MTDLKIVQRRDHKELHRKVRHIIRALDTKSMQGYRRYLYCNDNTIYGTNGRVIHSAYAATFKQGFYEVTQNSMQAVTLEYLGTDFATYPVNAQDMFKGTDTTLEADIIFQGSTDLEKSDLYTQILKHTPNTLSYNIHLYLSALEATEPATTITCTVPVDEDNITCLVLSYDSVRAAIMPFKTDYYI